MNGVEQAIISASTKGTLVFVHGAWHGPWCWTKMVDYFQHQGYECHTVTLRGHGVPGGNPRGINRYTISDYVQDVVDCVQKLGEQNVILVGHSMGGLLVQKYLEKHSCQKAILLAPVPTSGVLRCMLKFLRSQPSSVPSILTLNAHLLVNSAPKTRWAFFDKDTSEEEVQGHASQICGESYLAFLGMLRPGLRAATGVPVLVLGAENDRLFTPSQVAATARLHAAPCHMFPGAPHNFIVGSHATAVCRYMQEWLENGAATTSDI